MFCFLQTSGFILRIDKTLDPYFQTLKINPTRSLYTNTNNFNREKTFFIFKNVCLSRPCFNFSSLEVILAASSASCCFYPAILVVSQVVQRSASPLTNVFGASISFSEYA